MVPTDVTDEAAVERLATSAREAFGRIDILVNAAGVTGPIETPVWEIKADDFDQVIAVNLRGTFLPTKHVLPTMIKQRYGKIVNISGTSGLRGYKYRAAYSSSKWALRGFTRTVALEAGPYNINVNALHPGIVGGDRMDKLCREKAKKRGWTPEQVYQEYVDEMALRRVTIAQDIANAVLFLVSDDSSNMTGPVGHRRRRLGRLTPEENECMLGWPARSPPPSCCSPPATRARGRHPIPTTPARWTSSPPRQSSAPSVIKGAFAEGSALSLGAELKPLDPAPVKTVRLDTTHKIIEIAPGVKFSAWTFGDQVPGPTVRARVGDKIKFSMTNRSDEPMPGVQITAAPMMHSMDFHAAMVSPQDKYRSIAPGQTIDFEFTANYPGIFMYHCGTPMILEHIASGMYGAVIVEPRDGYPDEGRPRVRDRAERVLRQARSRASRRSTARRSTCSTATGCAPRSRRTPCSTACTTAW